ncbi:aquaporin-7 [Ixodes scapularis]|uniref:aquaporin-7 n=1 Tax=Ixodes scapularis TaxID=6945 RepID=UPI001161B481|nr:aquaporin-7 [Ixodes scapularis]
MGNPPFPFFKKFVTTNQAVREFLAEFFGTFILYIFGGASFAHYLFTDNKDVFAVTFCWGIGVMLGIQTGAGVSGGHVNPIVTTSFASVGKLPWRKVPHYLLGQHLGAFLAAAILYFNYIDLLDKFDGGARQIFGTNGTGILLSTYPHPDVHLSVCVFDTIICSGLLMFTIMVILDDRNANTTKGMHAFLIGIMVVALCWAFGSNCMAAVNPARDFPPRVLSALVGYGAETFSYRQFWWIPLFVPHLGGFIGTWLYVLFVGMHIPKPRRDGDEKEVVNLLPLAPRADKTSP